MPLWTIAAGRDGGHVDEVILDAVRTHAAGAQIDHACRRVEQPQIRVPLVRGRRETPVGSRQPFNRGYGLRAHQLLRQPGLVAFGCRRPTDLARAVEYNEGIVELPAPAVVTQPP